ncbi:MAG TPA: ChbG/HpnK family deacetylase [Symbiobacteriaceae bacterium]|nr:ChbG/HpnK family deacetylase [Symbiobacteriaceae bacterium]
MPGYLIVNADDFGLTAGVSRGIIKAHRQGILTSTTFMVNWPWAAELAPMLREVPDLGVGIHLNLTSGRPVLPPEQVPTLVNRQGSFLKSLLHLYTAVDPADARREWSAQVEKGIRLLGRLPTHLDTHRYLQGHPRYATVMIDVARTYNIPAVRCLYPGPDLALSDMVGPWNPTRLLVERFLRRSAEMVAGSGLACAQATMAGDFDLPKLMRKLGRVGPGVTELVSHPGEVDDQLRSLSSLQEHREVELAALTAPDVRRRVEEAGITLVHFGHLSR